jgi:HSP20 family protein
MTVLRLYQRNGHKPAHQEEGYRYSDLMRDYFGREANESSFTNPRVNIVENKDSWELNFALPGVNKEDININVEKDFLTVSHKISEKEEEGFSYNRKEFDFRGFERSFNLPESVNTEKIKAKMDNGILTVHLPKKDDAIDKGPREIKIS